MKTLKLFIVLLFTGPFAFPQLSIDSVIQLHFKCQNTDFVKRYLIASTDGIDTIRNSSPYRFIYTSTDSQIQVKTPKYNGVVTVINEDTGEISYEEYEFDDISIDKYFGESSLDSIYENLINSIFFYENTTPIFVQQDYLISLANFKKNKVIDIEAGSENWKEALKSKLFDLNKGDLVFVNNFSFVDKHKNEITNINLDGYWIVK